MYNNNSNYDLRNNEKKDIHFGLTNDFFINPREIWFVKMGLNIGFEENGKREFRRPVLVIKKVGNLFFTVALTSKGKNTSRFYHKIQTGVFNQNNQKYKNDSYTILSQVKVLDKKRFTENMGYVSEKEFQEIKQKLTALLL